MSKLEILCVTMHQTDFSKIEKMNIHSDVFFANQGDREAYEEKDCGAFRARMLSTKTRGVGLNRNLALEFAKGDILLFTDDDVIFFDDMERIVTGAFEKFPQADMIVFGNQDMKDGRIINTRCPAKTGKLPFAKSLRYGAICLAIRREAVLRYHLKFSELFGGGCLYSHGEDSDFIIQCFRSRLKIYTYSEIILTSIKDESSWFEGFDEKYFFDSGAFSRHSMGPLAGLFNLYIAFRVGKDSSLPYSTRFKALHAGKKALKRLTPYREWCKEREENE